MTRKHFQELAEMVKNAVYLSSEQKAQLANSLAAMCASHNPNFNRTKFLVACHG